MKKLITVFFVTLNLFCIEENKRLFSSAKQGDVKTMKQLLKKGISANIRNKCKQTPLFYAAKNHHTKVMQLLFKHGADPNIIDACKRTPLMYLLDISRNTFVDYLTVIETYEDYTNEIAILLTNGANPNIANYNEMPLTRAIRGNAPESIIALLVQNGANIQDLLDCGQKNNCQKFIEAYEKIKNKQKKPEIPFIKFYLEIIYLILKMNNKKLKHDDIFDDSAIELTIKKQKKTIIDKIQKISHIEKID
jgi:ankyrin repeat protein